VYAVEVSDQIMIAHSFRGEVFGPAQKTHGATFVIRVAFLAETPDAHGIVVDIARAHEVLKVNGALCVNILAGRHQDLSDQFGRHGIAVEQRFAGGSWTQLVTGAPVLTDAVASLDCRIARVAEVGTHSVLFCEVEEIATALQPEGLIYFNRLYHRIGSPLEAADEAYA